jgi:hypothetical protein
MSGSDDQLPPVQLPRDPFVERHFTYYPPKADQASRYQQLRDGAKAYAALIEKLCPPSADRTAALRKLWECNLVANGSIACNE